jgi:diguanylate cyclase (GGDEF)-like protein
MTCRRKQLAMRMTAELLLGVIWAPLVGWGWMGASVGCYTALQVFEVAGFSKKSPWFSINSRWTRLVALSVLSLSTVLFGAPTLIMTEKLGSWGDASTFYLLAGAVLHSVLTTIGCRTAFRASVLPLFGYFCIVPFNTQNPAGPPSSFWILVSLIAGGLFLMFTATHVWRTMSRKQAAEIATVRQHLAERDRNEERLLQMTQQDALTGLPNRRLLYTRLTEITQCAVAGALMLIDLDGFKYVNDTLGHSAGDRVLREIAGRIRRIAAGAYTAARLGGDEFALLLPGITDPAAAMVIADGLIADVSQPVLLDGQLINIGTSIGIAIHPLHGNDPEQLFSDADLALYQAKAEGRHCARLYAPDLRAVAQSKMLRDNELRLALEQGEFEIFYQPQVRLRDGALTGAEALLRWRHPQHGLLTPADFLPALEGGMLSAQVGTWVIEHACRQAAAWRAQGTPDFRIGVNLFGAQFRSGDLVAWVMQACAKAGLPPEALEIEITENIILRHEDEILTPLRRLRARGVGVAFDDYGTGFASLSMLTRLPVSRLKIDRSFTQLVCENASEAAVVQAVIGLARAMNLQVTAEGIETAGQAEALQQRGCDEAQGYYFGRSMSAAQFARQFGLGSRSQTAELRAAV